MKPAIVALLLAVLICSTADAGVVFGTMKADGKPAGKGTKIEILKNDTAIDSVFTDKNSFYRIDIEREGKVHIRITFDGHVVPFTVYSYKKPVRYNLQLIKRDGKYVARRE